MGAMLGPPTGATARNTKAALSDSRRLPLYTQLFYLTRTSTLAGLCVPAFAGTVYAVRNPLSLWMQDSEIISAFILIDRVVGLCRAVWS